MKKVLIALAFLLTGICLLQAQPIDMTDTVPSGLPRGWEAFGKGGSCRFENNYLRITDYEKKFEWGIRRSFAIQQPGRYTFSLEVALPPDRTDAGNMKLVLIAGNRIGSIGYLNRAKPGQFITVSSTIELFDKTPKITVYICGSHRETGDYLIRRAAFFRAQSR